MKNLTVVTRFHRSGPEVRNSLQRAMWWAPLFCSFGACLPAHAQTSLADEPLFTPISVPGNLALVLSVEFPTAISVAYTNRTYSSSINYLGYFDPNKCYTYAYTDGVSAPNPPQNISNYFQPAKATSNHICAGQSSPIQLGQWSGNFLNWATMQTIDPFRWVLTGGYRVYDDATTTVIEKAWGSSQGVPGNFPDSSVITGADVAGATPFPASAAPLLVNVYTRGNKMRFTFSGVNSSASFTGRYYNTNTTTDGNFQPTSAPVFTQVDSTINFPASAPTGPSVNSTNMSVIWKGTVTAPVDGNYTFQTKADDNIRLVVNGATAIVETNYDTVRTSPSYTFTAGQSVQIEVDYNQYGGNADVSLQWLVPGAPAYTVVGTGPGNLYGNSTPYNGSAQTGGVTYDVFVRAKVCDPTLGMLLLETNCKAYPTSTTTNYKPEGLLQKYSNQIRYSAFGYLNDPSVTVANLYRDGGVLRAQQKFIGPTQPVPGSSAVTNAPRATPGQTTGAEWDSNGVYIRNPDAADATNTSNVNIMGAAAGTIQDSGVLNYLNKFGVASHTYKTYDPVSELYYAAIRYFKNLPNVPDWYATPDGTPASTVQTWVDGFPVIASLPTAPLADPVLYACQRNFILGIGDTNTHADKNVPGITATNSEPTKPAAVSADPSIALNQDAVTETNIVGNLELLPNGQPFGDIGNSSNFQGGDANSAYIAGLAYDVHIHDIRGRPLAAGAKPQTIDTYWVDVQEGQRYQPTSQYYLAAKYGGFKVPSDWLTNPRPLTAANNLLTSWYTTTRTDPTYGQQYPDNYFSGGQPDAMQAGLNAAFASIAASLTVTNGSFATSLPQVANTDNAYYTTSYNAANWTGDVTAQVLAFDPTTGFPTPQTPVSWTFSTNLAATLANNGWSTKRQVVTWNGSTGVPFRASGPSQLASADLSALDTSYVSGNDSSNYLNYLRGDQSNEVGGTGTQAYRPRTKLIGDIVDSQIVTVGPPSFPFSDGTNPGYSAFKVAKASRRTMVYVGANDGMLHAINGALLTSAPAGGTQLEIDPNAGQEMFAYAPEALFKGPSVPNTANTDGLASLGNPSFVHHYMVDATPAVYDLDTANAGGATSTSPVWRSLLVGGLGKGGKTYFAIDVTDPIDASDRNNPKPYDELTYAGKVKWEFHRAEMGYTYGLPLITKTAKYGWVAIFTSGYNNADGVGYFIFVNPWTGEWLQTVSTGAGDPTHDAGLAHANAFVVDSTNGTSDAIYAGDLLGNLWRLDVTGTPATYPQPTRIATMTGADGSPQPVTSSPLIEVDPVTKQRVVLVGTGRLLAQSDAGSSAPQSFYAFFDGTNAAFKSATATPLFPYTRSTLAAATTIPTQVPNSSQGGWFVDLGGTVVNGRPGPAWRVISDSTTNAGSVAVPAVLPSGNDPCQTTTGQGRAYALQYSNGLSTLGDKDANGVTLPYVSENSPVTSLRFLSVNGKGVLAVGTNSSPISQININPTTSFPLRRLNWRELQSVD